MELKWITKARRHSTNGQDVVISFGKGNRVYFNFHNGAHKRIGGEAFVFAVTRHRIYFRKAEIDTGYKFSKADGGNDNARFASMKNDDAYAELKGLEGGYDLRLDRNMKLCYVELDEPDDWSEVGE